MQEQPLYKVTPDVGWSNMKTILDHEMPVNHRSRRILFFWWATASLAVISSIGLFVMSNRDNDPAVLPMEQPAITPKNETKTPAASTTNAIASASTQQSSTSSTSEWPLSKNSKSEGQSTSLRHSKYNSEKSSSENINGIVAGKELEQPIGSGINEQKTENTSFTTPQYLESKAVEPVINDAREISIASSIPTIQATELPIEESSYTVRSIEPSKVKRPVPLFEPDLSLSGLIGQNGGVGAYGGAGLSVNLNRKFSITTNLGYSSFQPNATILGTALADLAAAPESNAILIHNSLYSGFNTYIEASNLNTEAGYNEIEPLVESVNQWQVGAGIKWKLNRRFFTEAGVQIGLNTKVTSEYPIIDGDPQTGIVQGRIGNSFNSYDVVRSTMTSIYAGAGYRFGQHLDAFIQWKHGLDTYLLNDNSSIQNADQGSGERSDYIRGLNLGLRYIL